MLVILELLCEEDFICYKQNVLLHCKKAVPFNIVENVMMKFLKQATSNGFLIEAFTLNVAIV